MRVSKQHLHLLRMSICTSQHKVKSNFQTIPSVVHHEKISILAEIPSLALTKQRVKPFVIHRSSESANNAKEFWGDYESVSKGDLMNCCLEIHHSKIATRIAAGQKSYSRRLGLKRLVLFFFFDLALEGEKC